MRFRIVPLLILGLMTLGIAAWGISYANTPKSDGLDKHGARMYCEAAVGVHFLPAQTEDPLVLSGDTAADDRVQATKLDSGNYSNDWSYTLKYNTSVGAKRYGYTCAAWYNVGEWSLRSLDIVPLN